jgi:L-fuculose-phosphate aldolase
VTALPHGAARLAVCRYARRLAADGLVVGTAGNISVRDGDAIAVTPTGVDYAELEPALIPVVDPAGTVLHGALRPTSELPMHLAIYADAVDPEGQPIRAVVHTHSLHATAVGTLVSEIPPIHYATAELGGSVRVADYATYGTPELAAAALVALAGRRGCLLANHGALVHGPDLAAAYQRAAVLEWLCQLWLTASAAGAPRLLPPGEIERVVDKFRGYGQKP